MADYAKMTDEELNAAVLKKTSAPDFHSMSDSELDQAVHAKQGTAPPAGDPNRPWYDVSATGLAKGAMNALPAIGATVGGGVGLLASPIGAVIGAAGGAMAGKSLKDGVESLFGGGPQTRADQYKELAGAGMTGAAQEMGGQVLGAGVDYLKNAPAVVAKVEHVFPKDNPISAQVAGGLDAYKSQFKFPKDSTVERQLDELISRVKSTPPSQWSARDIGAITQRLGDDAIHGAVQAGEQKLAEVGSAISSAHPNAITGYLIGPDSLNPITQIGERSPGMLSQGAEWLAKKAGGAAGAVIGAHAGRIIPGAESAAAIGGYYAGNKMADMAINAIKIDPELAEKLGMAMSKNFEGKSVSAMLNSPEAKDIMLHHFLEKANEPEPASPAGPQMPALSRTIKAGIARK